MPELNKDRIFNESPTKVLLREYTKMKEDYSKLSALKYFTLYENASLSFILENSRYIFSEPIKGYNFYKNIMETAIIPFNNLETELEKVSDYFKENSDKMSETQNEMYSNLVKVISERVDSLKNSSHLYKEMIENSSVNDKYYDALYEYTKNRSTEALGIVGELIESATPSDLMDVVNISSHIPVLSPFLFKYIQERCFVESPVDTDDYRLNSYTTNVLYRMMMDKPIIESVESIPNINARHLIMGLSGLTDNEVIESVTIEKVNNYDSIYSTSINSINRIFEDDFYSEMFEEQNSEEKLNRLNIEKCIIESSLSFALMDYNTYDEGDLCNRNSIVEKLCIESTTRTEIPNTYEGHIEVLQERLDEINSEIENITGEPVIEKYFSDDGSASKVVASSIGSFSSDTKMPSNDDDQYSRKIYTPTSKVNDLDDDDDNTTSFTKQSDADKEEKRAAAKKRRDDKYANMSIDNFKFESEEDDDTEGTSTKYINVDKPEKKPFFQRVQNKALDADVKFKRKVANARRKSVDARNAGKAVAKIPSNITSSIKKTVDEWDEMDDNRRKEYMIKPGFRKKYFRALKIAITHGAVFAINPLLNIVLLMCQKLSNMKDVRIRNELTRELQAEIKVVDAKIEDANGAGDKSQKYKLMRIREKLDAELVRVGTNSKIL